jgi:hypothetical protein
MAVVANESHDGTNGISDVDSSSVRSDGIPVAGVTDSPAWLGTQSLGVTEDDMESWCPALLDALLVDNATGGNIIWATEGRSIHGVSHVANEQISPSQITGEMRGTIRPRVAKAKATQTSRTKEKAEVFTPSWICNMQNNVVDRAWFGGEWADRKSGSPFNDETERSWEATSGRISFPDSPDGATGDGTGRTWEAYVRANRMEMACGEAPYLVSRYDTTTGNPIPLCDRIGLLDRKLRVVSENATDDDWRAWAIIALQSCYAFEYQGDSLLIARENVLLGWADAYMWRLGHAPSAEECLEAAHIVSWNIWQMDAFTMCVPGTEEKSVIMNWETGQSYEFERQVHRG